MTVTLSLTPVDEGLTSGEKTLTLDVGANANYSVGTQGQATVTIHDNDGDGNVSAESRSTSEIDLYWQPVSGAEAYQIFRSDDSSFIAGNDTEFDVASVPSYIDDEVQSNTHYFYEIDAIHPGGTLTCRPCRSNYTIRRRTT